MSNRRRYGNRLEIDEFCRVEVDVIRFDVSKLESGLFRHVPIKYVFELSRREERQRQRAVAAS